MKSFVTNRTESVGAIGVCGPVTPSGVFHIPVTTGVVPVQPNVTLRPETCGNRPVPPAKPGSQNGVKPFTNACRSWSPVSVRITVRLPNGRTANISPHVISPTASPAAGGAMRRSCRRPPEFVNAASTPGYFARIASVTRLPMADSNSRLGARRMSTDCVPITLLRSTAVSAFALSTIACTSARAVTPRVFATRVAPPAHSTSPPLTISCSTE